MSITDEQFTRIKKVIGSAEATLAAFSELLLNEKTYFFARCYRDADIVSALITVGLQELLEVLMFGQHSDLVRLRSCNNHPLISHRITNEKLQVLAFVSASGEAVARGVSRITYDTVAAEAGLELGDVRGVEDLVLSAMSADLVDCRMNQRERFVEIISAQPREVLLPHDSLSFVQRREGRCDDLKYMLNRLRLWKNNTQKASMGIEHVGDAVRDRQTEIERIRHLRDHAAAEVFRDEVAAEKNRRLVAGRE